LALDLFALQYEHNAPYRAYCEGRRASPKVIERWSQIPAVPTTAFKEAVFSCLPTEARTAVFHSSGTTGQRPSRHFHSAESLALYETSLLPWFETHLLPELSARSAKSAVKILMIILTPAPSHAPRSSLVHMFEAVRRAFGSAESLFLVRSPAEATGL